jgi:hypothetical protein
MGYWMYANATKNRDSFDGRLDFEMTLVPYKGSTDWVDGCLMELKACLDSDEIPAAGQDCDYCRYREAAGKALLAKKAAGAKAGDTEAPAPVKSKKIAAAKKDDHATQSLF